MRSIRIVSPTGCLGLMPLSAVSLAHAMEKSPKHSDIEMS